MQYILNGFTHEMGFRVFAFQGIGEHYARTEYSVKADLAATRRYGIRVQELPLLCRGILERRGEEEERHAFTYTEADMSLHADVCAAEALAHKRRTPRRPPVPGAGAAHRDPRLPTGLGIRRNLPTPGLPHGLSASGLMRVSG
jgi:hypothetical protein